MITSLVGPVGTFHCYARYWIAPGICCWALEHCGYPPAVPRVQYDTVHCYSAYGIRLTAALQRSAQTERRDPGKEKGIKLDSR